MLTTFHFDMKWKVNRNLHSMLQHFFDPSNPPLFQRYPLLHTCQSQTTPDLKFVNWLVYLFGVRIIEIDFVWSIILTLCCTSNPLWDAAHSFPYPHSDPTSNAPSGNKKVQTLFRIWLHFNIPSAFRLQSASYSRNQNQRLDSLWSWPFYCRFYNVPNITKRPSIPFYKIGFPSMNVISCVTYNSRYWIPHFGIFWYSNV